MAGNGIAPCSKVTDENLAEMKKLIRECEYKLKSSTLKNVSLPNTGSFCYDLLEVNLDPKKRKGTSGPLSKAFNKEARDQCDAEVTRMFYTGGLSFNLARNPYYRNSYVRASTLPGYVPPGYNALRTTLLQQEKNHIEQCLQPIKRTWSTKGVSLCSDRWTDAQRRPLINIMTTCESEPMFLRPINCEGEYKDKHCIANFLTEAIKEIGHENVVQVITDNAPVCRVAGLLIEAHYPHIFWTPCVVHTLNLALKSICSPKQTHVSYDDCNWISTIASDVWSIKIFMNHSMRLSMFNEHCKLKLLSIAETGFASTLVMLRRFKEVKKGLQQMVISPNWALYKEDDLVKAMSVKQKILDEYFWEKIEYILFFTTPIYEVIRMVDTDKPCLHLVYEWWDTMIEKVKAAIYRNERKALHEKSSFFDAVYYSSEWLQEDPGQVAPHRDVELTTERKKCFERYFSNEEIRRSINVEYACFSMCLNDFGAIDSMNERFHSEPVMWWIVHGASTPSLQSIALKLLGQPCSSSCCERNWSTYSFIHSLRRNKITPQRAEDLVFVHNNLRLLSRNSSTYKEGITQLWDVGGDGFENLGEESVGMRDIANLSLDEPSLETTLITRGDIMNVEVE
ncbi:uncharacterized protein LOC125473520 [Pyrus x bretschneideri]|uniref:uncharacterized protein LOC125473520 n=1 Tax=Pyrus x bretschneideri TaxID=225117 RepID=UPI002030B66D|nr:uncharacterized protein LOC125473520 [Pyrus x bretschneideri]